MMVPEKIFFWWWFDIPKWIDKYYKINYLIKNRKEICLVQELCMINSFKCNSSLFYTKLFYIQMIMWGLNMMTRHHIKSERDLDGLFSNHYWPLNVLHVWVVFYTATSDLHPYKISMRIKT